MRSSPICRAWACATRAGDRGRSSGGAMNPIWGHVVGVVIVVLMLVFIGIWIWAWLPFHKKSFDALARIPMR